MWTDFRTRFRNFRPFAAFFAVISVIFLYHLEIDNIIYKNFELCRKQGCVWSWGAGTSQKDIWIKKELCLNFKAELDITLHHSSLCGYILPQYTIYIAAGTLACIICFKPVEYYVLIMA